MTFRMSKMFARKRISTGFTRLELGFFLVSIIFVGLLAVTKFLDLSVLVDGSMDQGVVEAVQRGIAAYARESKETQSAAPSYPPFLDEAEVGASTPHNLFFFYVLPKGIAAEGWSKTGSNAYRAPNGGDYLYDPRAGTFEIQGAGVEDPIADSDRPK